MNILTCYYCTDEAIEVATIPDKRQDELLAEFERRAKVSLALIIIITKNNYNKINTYTHTDTKFL